MALKMKFLVKLRQMGGSLGFCVPAEVKEFFKLKKNQIVEVDLEKPKK